MGDFNMEDLDSATKKSNKKGLIACIIILIVLLLGAVTYICYDKFIEKDSTEAPDKQEVKQLTESDIKQLHNKLLTQDKSMGFYFLNDLLTIDTIKDHDLLEYILINYFVENQIQPFDPSESFEATDIDFSADQEGYSNVVKYAPESAKITSDQISNYIKTTFNVDKNIALESENGEAEQYIARALYNGERVIYDKTTGTYVFYSSHSGKYFSKGANKIINYEQDNDNIYIYDKAIFCSYGATVSESCTKTVDDADKDEIAIANNGTKTVEKPANITMEQFTPEYLVENMSEQLNTYKHTFKKAANGNYYWYSTEIIK